MTTTTIEPMTWDKWKTLTPAQKDAARDYSNLTEQLKGLEGWRVEVIDVDDQKRRFIVGRSTGWKPIHLEIKTRRSLAGDAASTHYKSVVRLYKVHPY